MTLGSPCRVTTANAETERWFSQIFASADSGDSSGWWETARQDSDLGVLVGVESRGPQVEGKQSRITELLFYASRTQPGHAKLPTPPPTSSTLDTGPAAKTPVLSVHALLLSSDLLHDPTANGPTPPDSPTEAEQDVEPVFFPQSYLPPTEVINEPPVRKRRSAAEAFDEASERRKKARRRGGEGVIAAAAPKAETQVPSLKHRRSASNTQPTPLQTRPLSRSPSIASSRPTTAGAQTAKRSSLAHMQTQSTVEANLIEAKNKDFISRIVMAGMRLHGLSQSKSRNKHRTESAAASPAVDSSFDELEVERRQDEEFKLIYHQTYKGTCFAFRATVGAQMLQPCAEQVRETVDKFLTIFCGDPLAAGLPAGEDKVTPGGRKAFGSRTSEDGKSPFLQAAGQAIDSTAPTAQRTWTDQG